MTRIKLWLILGAIGLGVAGLVYWQQSRINDLHADVAVKDANIAALNLAIEQQYQRHTEELAAIDASMEALDEAKVQADRRAQTLSQQLRQAGQADAELEMCLNRELPAAVFDSLPK